MIAADDRPDEVSWPKRLAWLAILWLLGVAVVGMAAIAIRLVMHLAGLTT